MASRDPWLDNAKMTLITLVVAGHTWGLLPQGTTTDQVYDFLYVWHMPAFVLISGYLSRHSAWSGRRLWLLVRTLVVPYVLFEAVFALYAVQVGGREVEDLFLVPLWPLWYLVALTLWRLVTPAVLAVRPVTAVVGGAAIGTLGGLVDYPYLDLGRVLGLFPFFVLGLVVTRDVVERLRTRSVRLAGLGVLVVTLLVVRDLDSWADTNWLYFQSYDALGVGSLEGAQLRLVFLLLGLCCSVAVLSLVPSREGWYTQMGAATMVVFLFHGFVQRAVDYAGFEAWAWGHPVAAPVLAVIGSVGVTFLLAWRPVTTRLKRLSDPLGVVEDAVRPTPDAAGRPATGERRRELSRVSG